MSEPAWPTAITNIRPNRAAAGAVERAFADRGFDAAVMNGLLMIARVPGLVAHAAEEHARMKPMRRIDPVNHACDDPADRSLEG